MARKNTLYGAESILSTIPTRQLQEFIEFLRDKPVLASELLLCGPGGRPLTLAPHERMSLRNMWTSRWILNVWGRGTGKCQVGTDRLLLADGSYEELQNLVDTDVKLLALDGYKLTKADGSIRHNGKKECVKITLKSGRELTVTMNHPLLKIDGWYKASELVVGDRIATPRKYNIEGSDTLTDVEAKLLGYLIGDGGTTGKQATFTNAEDVILKDFSDLISTYNTNLKVAVRPNSNENNRSTTLAVSRVINSKHASEPFYVFVEKHGLICKAKEKRVPKDVFKSSNEHIALFLNRYFACDGYVSKKNSISVSSASKGLIQDVQHLLLRFGILSAFKYKEVKLGDKSFDSWYLTISGKENVLRFISSIGIFGKKAVQLAFIEEELDKVTENTNVDTIPKEIWKIAKKLGIKIKSRSHLRCWHTSNSPSRQTFANFADDFGIGDFKDLAESDIFWDTIVQIERVGKQDTYAVSVPKYMNYVSNDIINHNTFMDGVYSVLRCLLFPNEKIVIVGPSFRQAIFVFAEAEKLIMNSPFAKQALADKPKHHANEFRIIFSNGSTITALPLGTDGSKVRGTRATVIIVDETAQVPAEILDMAIIPFMTTKKDPMSEYLGLAESGTRNTLVFSSSAYYQFNHLFDKYKYWLKQVNEGNPDYFLSKFNYFDTPPGFIDLEVVEMQRKTSADIIFRMEYLAEFPRDSIGFFPASLLHKCMTRFVTPLESGRKGYNYVMGLDPARSSDNFGIVILELEGEYRNVVRVEAHNNRPFPEMKMRILDLMERFNIVRLGSDAYGGGTAIADLLEQDNVVMNPKTGILERRPPIIVVGDKDARTRTPNGREILDLVIFSSPTLAEMNYELKAKMEHGLLRIPAAPYSSDFMDSMGNSTDLSSVESAENEFFEVYELIRELENVAVEAQTKSGYLKFDVPDGFYKDRYSALLVANRAADNYHKSPTQLLLPAGFWL